MIPTLIFLIVICISGVLWLTWRQADNLYSPLAIYTYFFALTFVLRPLLLIFGIDTPTPDNWFNMNTDATQLKIVTYALVWSAIFLFAFAPDRSQSPLLRFLPNTTSVSTTRLAAIVLTLLGMTALQNLWLVINYGFSIGDISYAVRLDRVFSGFSFLNNIPLYAAYLGMAYVWTSARRNPTIMTYLVAFGSICGALTYIWYGDRDNIALWFLFALTGTSLFLIRIPVAIQLILPPVLAGFLMLLSNLRLSSWGYIPDPEPLFRNLSTSLNLNCFDNLMLFYVYFGQGPLHWGSDFMLGIVNLVPRFLWEGKPIATDVGIWLTQQFISDANYGWPITAVGEWAINFGVAGVILGAYLTGAGYRLFQSKYSDMLGNPVSYTAFWFLATRILQIGISTITPVSLVMNLIPMAITFYLCRATPMHHLPIDNPS